MDAAIAFADNAININYEDLPPEAIEVTRKSILDTIGVILAASTLGDGVKEILNLVEEAGGNKESTIIAFGKKVPCWMAAFANGSMTHAIDYDDVHDEGQSHPTSHVFTAALAAAERAKIVTGKEFITAVALGCDMANRLGLAISRGIDEHGWLAPSVIGYFSSTMSAGKLLKLSKQELAGAFGIALNQAAGSMAMCYDTNSKIRAIRDAFCAKGGVLSAVLAQIGITGLTNSLEGKAGLFKIYFGGEYNPKVLTNNLGKTFEGVNTSFKPWPTCRTSHTYIEAVLRLLNKHDIKPEEIKEIILVVGDTSLPLCEPLEERRKPKLAIGAKNSLPFIIGTAVARRKVVIGDFLKYGLNDQAALNIAQKVNYRYDNHLKQSGEPPAIVDIITRDGKRYSIRIDRAYGNPKNPINLDDLILKFKDCTTYSVKPLSESRVANIIEKITHLEDVKDMSEVISLLG
jgi:2-methylcitrate dehydratase PrpD